MNDRRQKTTRLITAIMLIAIGCAPGVVGPPEVTLDRSACSRCGMLISSLEFAAAARSTTDGSEKQFDDAACLLDAHLDDSWQVWFSDFNGTGWVDASKAAFVTQSGVRTPMGGGILAFADLNAARSAAQREGGTVVTSVSALPGRVQ